MSYPTVWLNHTYGIKICYKPCRVPLLIIADTSSPLSKFNSIILHISWAALDWLSSLKLSITSDSFNATSLDTRAHMLCGDLHKSTITEIIGIDGPNASMLIKLSTSSSSISISTAMSSLTALAGIRRATKALESSLILVDGNWMSAPKLCREHRTSWHTDGLTAQE